MVSEIIYRISYIILGVCWCMLYGWLELDVIMYGVFNGLVGNENVLFNAGVLEMLEVIISLLLIVGIVCNIPLMWLELYSVVVGGLIKSESSYLIMVLFSCWILLNVGIVVGVGYIVPNIVSFMEGVSNIGMLKVELLGVMSSYLIFVEEVCWIVIVISQIPVIVSILGVSDTMLMSGSKVVYLCGIVVSGLISPPDVMSQLLLFSGIVIMFELVLILSLTRSYVGHNLE